MRYFRYKSPDGAEIIGTAETIPGVALLSCISEDGSNIDYDGSTDVDWDGQEKLQRDGKLLFVCDNGEFWTFDQLIKDEEVG